MQTFWKFLCVGGIVLASVLPASAQTLFFRENFQDITGIGDGPPPNAFNGGPLQDAYGPSINGRTPHNLNPVSGRTWSASHNTAKTYAEAADQLFDRTPYVLRTTSGGGGARPSGWGSLDSHMDYLLSSEGGFSRPGGMTVSAVLFPNSSPQAPGETFTTRGWTGAGNTASASGGTITETRFGVGIGFYGSVKPSSTQASWTGFTGVLAQDRADNLGPGINLRILVDGDVKFTLTSTSSALDGSNWLTLAYTVDFGTGALTDLTWGGTTFNVPWDATTPNNQFTLARTQSFGIYTAIATPEGAFGNFPKFDNITLTTAIPEPSGINLVMIAMAALLIRHLRTSRAGRSRVLA